MSTTQPTPSLVLVVEDDALLMLGMVDLVEEAGFAAVEASSVDEAIQLLETRSDIRTVFTDLDMRGSTAGMRFAVSIRDRWPPIELVMVSSRPWAEKNAPQRGLIFGKPFDKERIIGALKAFAG